MRGRPLGVGVQAEAPDHLTLRWSADAPGGRRGELLVDDDPGDQSAVQRGGRHAEHRGGRLDGDELALGALGGRLTARDIAIAAQVAHVGAP